MLYPRKCRGALRCPACPESSESPPPKVGPRVRASAAQGSRAQELTDKPARTLSPHRVYAVLISGPSWGGEADQGGRPNRELRLRSPWGDRAQALSTSQRVPPSLER